MRRGQKHLAAAWMVFCLVIVVAGTLLYLAFTCFYRAAYPIGYREQVEAQSLKNGLHPALVYAVIRTESGFNPSAQSSVKARGLMQVTEAAFEWTRMRMGEDREIYFDDLYDGGENIRYGTALLRLHLEEFGSERVALCAYHAGRSNVLKWLSDPACSPDGKSIENIPFGDTGRYVEKVLATKRTYQKLYRMAGIE